MMAFPHVTRKQRHRVHAIRMAHRFAKASAKKIEQALKEKKHVTA